MNLKENDLTYKWALCRDGKTAMIGTDNGFVILYTTADLAEIQVHGVGKKKVMAVLASSNGRYFISAAETVHVWTADSGQHLRAP